MFQSGWFWFSLGFVCMLLIGWLALPFALYEEHDQPLQFSHKVHTEGTGMACDDCHAFLDDGRFSGIPAIAKCAECHAEIVGSSPYEKRLVEEFVRQNKEVPWKMYARQPQNAYFPHAQHVKLANLACETCHGSHGTTDSLRTFERNRLTGYSRDVSDRVPSGIFQSSGKGLRMDDCADCHRERNVSNTCMKCHK